MIAISSVHSDREVNLTAIPKMQEFHFIIKKGESMAFYGLSDDQEAAVENIFRQSCVEVIKESERKPYMYHTIVVFKDGVVVQRGKYVELLKQTNGLFLKLIQAGI